MITKANINANVYSEKNRTLLLSTVSQTTLQAQIYAKDASDAYIVGSHVFLFRFQVLSTKIDYTYADKKWGRFNEITFNNMIEESFKHVFNLFNNNTNYNPGRSPFKFSVKYVKNRGVLLYLKGLESQQNQVYQNSLKFLE